MKRFQADSWLLILMLSTAASLNAQDEVPASHGAARLVDTPVLTVPLLAKPPEINGVMAPGEWDDASALSAFNYDVHFGMFYFLAPHQTQL